MALTIRATKGSPLTIAEADANVTTLRDWIYTLQAISEPVVSIDYIETVGRQMTIHLTDHSQQGPFELPLAAWTSRGRWTISTSYSAMDVVTYRAQVYLVLVTHTSSSTSFDPEATDGLGRNLYSLMLVNPNSTVVDHTEDSFTPTILDVNAYHRMHSDHETTIYIDTISADADMEMHFRQVGEGAVLFEALSPAVINPVRGYLDMTATVGATATLKCVATDEWDLMGLLMPASG